MWINKILTPSMWNNSIEQKKHSYKYINIYTLYVHLHFYNAHTMNWHEKNNNTGIWYELYIMKVTQLANQATD